jgi:hypothetical protein
VLIDEDGIAVRVDQHEARRPCSRFVASVMNASPLDRSRR